MQLELTCLQSCASTSASFLVCVVVKVSYMCYLQEHIRSLKEELRSLTRQMDDRHEDEFELTRALRFSQDKAASDLANAIAEASHAKQEVASLKV